MRFLPLTSTLQQWPEPVLPLISKNLDLKNAIAGGTSYLGTTLQPLKTHCVCDFCMGGQHSRFLQSTYNPFLHTHSIHIMSDEVIGYFCLEKESI